MKNLTELTAIRDAMQSEVNLRKGEKSDSGVRTHVLICGGTGCTSSGSMKIKEAMIKKIEEEGLSGEVKVVGTGCFGLCALGPIMIVYPEGTFYSMVTVEDVPEIVEEHLKNGRPVTRLVYHEKKADTDTHVATRLSDTTFYKKQHRVALRNCGVIDPENIQEYIAMDGYKALGKVLTEMTPQEVIDVIKASGLRGRGGAGFPTGTKCSSRRRSPPARNTSAATQTRATRVRLWTVRCWRGESPRRAGGDGNRRLRHRCG